MTTTRRLVAFNRTQADQHAYNYLRFAEAADRHTGPERDREQRLAGWAFGMIGDHLDALPDEDLLDAHDSDRNSTDADRVRAAVAGRIIASRIRRGRWSLGA